MRNRFIFLIPLMAILAAGCAVSGHQDEPTEAVYKYFDWEIEFVGAVHVLTTARKAGKIDDEAFRWINPILQEGDKLLDELHDDIKIKMKTTPAEEKIVPDVNLTTRFLNVLEKLLFIAADYKGGE